MVRSGTNVHQHRIRRSSLDAAAVRQLVAAARAAASAGVRAFIIDFSGVELLDAEGISALLMLRRQVLSDVRVVLASMSAAAQKVARVAHLYEFFDVYADARTAVEDLSI